MHYDPLKDRLNRMLVRVPPLRPLFYLLLNLYFLRAWYVRRALRSLRRSFQPGWKVLDAGTGFGQYTRYMYHLFPGARITAIDLKRDYLANLQRMYRANGQVPRFQYGNLLELEWENEFDLILNVDVMEHIEDDREVFRRFGRALKPGGRLLLHTPALPEDYMEEEHHAFVGEHVRDGYKHSDIRKKLTEAGFMSIQITPTYGFWGGIAWKLLIRYPVSVAGRWKWTLPLLVFWYLPVFPLAMVLHSLELSTPNQTGGCLLLTAEMPHDPEIRGAL